MNDKELEVLIEENLVCYYFQQSSRFDTNV